VNDKVFKIDLTLNELNVILAYLGKQPYENVYIVSRKLTEASAESDNASGRKGIKND
jgi:hypothetical protein